MLLGFFSSGLSFVRRAKGKKKENEKKKNEEKKKAAKKIKITGETKKKKGRERPATGPYWVFLLGSLGDFYCFLPSSPCSHWVSSRVAGFDWVLPSFTGFFMVLPGFT